MFCIKKIKKTAEPTIIWWGLFWFDKFSSIYYLHASYVNYPNAKLGLKQVKSLNVADRSINSFPWINGKYNKPTRNFGLYEAWEII
jgi:hypothetical protein